MPRTIARNASLYIDNTSSACISVSGFMNQVTLSRSSESPEVTGFGENHRQRLAGGINDWELSFAGFFDTGASLIDQFLNDLLGGSTVMRFGPSGSSSGSLMYIASAVLTEYNSDFALEGAATISGTLMARSGSLTRGTWA